jgi:UDP-N-acetyl-D-mannosaminuronic acid dehydrogenase
MGSAEAAELTKLAETTYRDVNIALANEFARFADRTGIDLDRVIAAANSQPFSHIHRPGVAVGGHCIPVYPRFYLDADPGARLPGRRARGQRGDAGLRRRPARGRARLAGRARVVILGVAYRGNVKEAAFSGAFALRDALPRAAPSRW